MSDLTEQSTGRPGNKLGLPLIITLILLYIVDQVSKMLVVFNYQPPLPFPDGQGGYVTLTDSTPVIEGFFHITRIHNTGVAFGFGNGEAWSIYVFLALPIIALVALIIALRKGFFDTKWLKLAWVFLFAGICGNITDRLVQGFISNSVYESGRSFWQCIQSGYVVDFLDVTIPIINYRWPVFNVADSCICIAAGIFLITSFTYKPKEKGSITE